VCKLLPPDVRELTIEQVRETISKNFNKNVQVQSEDVVIVGELVNWISAFDNEPDGESIMLHNELYIEIP
jgi:hypothetical protein